ncbi:MAG: carbonic anhydrase family protein [Deltaproteobacteria bacterium]|jgi:carbonic anhydrase|nr:carbonic anhydrase family protein [Deltaproteobacteria bacterium]
MLRTPRATLTLLAALTLLTACECRQPKPDVEPETAVRQEAREERYALPGLDHGLVQSPVNILSGRAEGGHHEIAINMHGAEPNHLENKGHTIQLDFQPGSSVTLDGNEYQLKQAHFHTPSEHQIDGITYPMEGHIVNMIEPKTPEEPPRYLVVSFLFRMGEADPFITSFLDQVPSEEGGEELEAGQVYLSPNDRNPDYEYYHYRGSLTTPPYTETVEWLIVKEIQQASPEQIRRIHLLEGDNARRVQALYGRKVDD